MSRKFDRFRDAEFIGIDSEGVSSPPDADGFQSHKSVLWMASDGAELLNPEGLHSYQILDWLLSLGASYERNKGGSSAVFVIYGGSYDFNMCLKDLPQDEVTQIWRSTALVGSGARILRPGRLPLVVSMVPRKKLSIAEITGFTEDNKPVYGRKILIYDVIGFFQETFVSCIKKWLGKDYSDLSVIEANKAQRSMFHVEQIGQIRDYTRRELRALVAIMNRFRDSLSDIGIKIDKWHGAGAVAQAMLAHNGAKAAYDSLPEPVHSAALHAYFGGRIELIQFGHHPGPVYGHDINSAYPNVHRRLPYLKGGRWSKMEKAGHVNVQEWGVYEVEWASDNSQPIYPFPYRSGVQHKVFYPGCGRGWFWAPEVKAAMSAASRLGMSIKIHRGFVFQPKEASPFGWIEDYYAARQKLIQAAKLSGIEGGAEKVYKLGVNALYGKTAQTVGGTVDKPPAYHNMFYAGYITSQTRAMLFEAAMQAPDKIIMLSTDGIYSTVPLAVDISTSKELGKWETDESEAGLFIQSGYYFLKSKGKWKPKTRGFDRVSRQEKIDAQVDTIMNAWGDKKPVEYFPCTRFITLGTALSGGDWFRHWCTWYAMRGPEGQNGRKLALYPFGTKRCPVDKLTDIRADKRLHTTLPLENLTPKKLGERYELGWVEDTQVEDIEISGDLLEDFDE
jgi:DNA polymerase type B, organellar and viral